MDLLYLLLVPLLGAPFFLSLIAIIIALRNRSLQDTSALVAITERHERLLGSLERELRALRDRLGQLSAEAARAASPAQQPPGVEPVPTPTVKTPVTTSEAVRIPSQQPVTPAALRIEAAPPKPAQTAQQREAVPASAVPPLTMHPEIEAGRARPAEPSVPPPPSAPAIKMPGFDWEGLVGVKLFSWIAGIALLLAAIFFLRYSIDRGWLNPLVRMAIGAIVGMGLLVLCELKAARKYPVTANAMDASAIAILFSTFFAANALWHLIDTGTSFVLLILVTVVAVLLSIRRDSLFIALLGLLGGFAAPALLSTGENRPISLFGYLLLLNAGLAWVASRKKWPLLTTVTLLLTTLYQWGWVMKFLTSGQLPLAAGIFLVFPILTFVSVTAGRAEGADAGWLSLYGRTGEVSALLPLLFAVYMASVSGYGTHYVILFGFLFLLDAGLLAIATARGRDSLHFVSGISTLLVFAIWFTYSYDSSAWPAILGFLALFVLFYLASPMIGRRFGRTMMGPAARAVFVAPLLLAAFAVLAAIEPACADPALIFGVLFVLLAAVALFATLESRGAVYFLAAFFALAAEAVWSAKYLTAERLYSALALYLVFGLFYIGVPAAARLRHRTLHPEGAGIVLLLGSLALLFFLAGGGVSVWGLALLLLILNAGLFLEGSFSRFPRLSIVGIALSWFVLGYFWSRAELAAILIPALVVVAGFAVLAMAGMIWMQKRATGADATVLGNGVFLGLAGHLFLLVVASQKTLSIPPWPLLTILLVLDLAVGAAALYTRRNALLTAAMSTSVLILMIWTGVAGIAPWPSVGILSAAALVLLSLIWIYLAEGIGLDSGGFADTAQITTVLAQISAIVAAQQSGSPGVGFLIAAHLVFLVVLLSLAWARGRHYLATVALIPASVAVTSWIMLHPGTKYGQSQLLFAGLVYAVFLAYPLLLGRRAGGDLGPYLAAVLASVPFFFQARYTIMEAGREDVIGILPVTQAGLLSLLLVRLLRIEPPGKRALGRLALVAGAVLAFVTVAIPLQLEREWITIGWALEGTALAWLFRRIPHRGLLYATSGLMAAVFVRLALNPSVLTYEPRGDLRIWNWYLYTYLVAAAAMILAGWLLSKTKDTILQGLPRASGLFPGGGTILLFLLLNLEIADFYSTGASITFNFSATLAQDLTYTLGWAVFAVALLATGIAIGSRPARISALVLLAATVVKCFLHDLARLGGLYRVMSFVGLALCLALVALALQKFVLTRRKEAQ